MFRQVFGLILAMVSVAAFGQESAGPILEKSDVAEGYASEFAEMQQIITTSGGQKRTLVIRAWAVHNGEKQLSEYLAPADIEGQKILMTEDGDNIWMFNPETRRTRKLGSHMKKRKMMGSDFTYEDQAGGKFSEKFSGVVLGEEQQGGIDCSVLDLKPTPKGPSYGKIIAYIGKEDFITRRVDYFREGESEPFKRLILEDVRQVGEKRVAHKMTMTNLADRTETVNLLDKVQFGVELPDSIFESRNLEK
jgi:outer membrane lipoprotein-sorting protein